LVPLNKCPRVAVVAILAEIALSQRSNLAASSGKLNIFSIYIHIDWSGYIPHMLEPLKKLGVNSHKVNKLQEHSVQYAYKFVSTRRLLEKSNDSTIVSKVALLGNLLVLI